jgi:predicted PurR-regulated permease PerM
MVPSPAPDAFSDKKESAQNPSPAPRRRASFAGSSRPWIVFAGCVLLVAVLRWAEAVLIPVGLALLLTFLLNPPVSWLQRWIGRPAAVTIVVTLAVVLLGAAIWTISSQVMSLSDELPTYRQNLRAKVADIRGRTDSRSIEEVQTTLEDLKREITQEEPPRSGRAGQVVVVNATATWLGLPAWLSPLFGVLGTSALVIVLVSFMLIEYRDLRDRFVALIGYGYVANTTKALDEAATRLSRYLSMQLLINASYGAIVAAGLWVIGVPYAVLWGVLGTILRFVPYVGPWIAAGAPTLLSLGNFPGWTEPLWTIGLFVGAELFTNLVLETVLYAGAAGVSQVALLIAVAFWTWLWGPIGLLMATPLTVCLVVIGKHVPGLWFISTMIADAPPLSVQSAYYQRLLAGDQAEALDLVEDFTAAHPVDEVYDALMLPALNFAERDRRDGRISDDDERTIGETTRDLLLDALAAPAPASPAAGSDRVLPVLGYPNDAFSDEVALEMLKRLVAPLPVQLDIKSGRMLVSEMVTAVREGQYSVVCLADLPPNSPSKARFLVKRLRQTCPDLKILVGRWAPPDFAPDARGMLIDAGATEVLTSLSATRELLRELSGTDLAVRGPEGAAPIASCA